MSNLDIYVGCIYFMTSWLVISDNIPRGLPLIMYASSGGGGGGGGGGGYL